MALPFTAAEPKQVSQLASVTAAAQLGGAYYVVDIPNPAYNPLTPGGAKPFLTRRLAHADLLAALAGGAASRINAVPGGPKIVLWETAAGAASAGGGSTLEALPAAVLCVGTTATVLQPNPHRLVLAADPTGPLQVATDGGFTGATTAARWLSEQEAFVSGVPAFNPLRAQYGEGEQVSHKPTGRSARSLFQARQDMARASFNTNQIPAPTGVNGDLYWEEISPPDTPVLYERLTTLTARAAQQEEAVFPGRPYQIQSPTVGTILTEGLFDGTSFSPVALRVETNGSHTRGTYVLTASAETFTPDGAATAGGSGYSDAQADARVVAATANTLTQTTAGKVLDARQGKVLADRLGAVEGSNLDALNAPFYSPDPADPAQLKGYASLEDALEELNGQDSYLVLQGGPQATLTRTVAVGNVTVYGRGQVIAVPAGLALTNDGYLILHQAGLYNLSGAPLALQLLELHNSVLQGAFSVSDGTYYNTDLRNATLQATAPTTLTFYGSTTEPLAYDSNITIVRPDRATAYQPFGPLTATGEPGETFPLPAGATAARNVFVRVGAAQSVAVDPDDYDVAAGVLTFHVGYAPPAQARVWGDALGGAPSGGGSTPTQLSAPSGLSATPVSSSSIGTSWNAAANNSGYRVQRATNAAFSANASIVYTGNALSYADTGLSVSTTYYYRVLALGTGNYSNSAYSSGVSATTAPTGTTPPDAPANFAFNSESGLFSYELPGGTTAADYEVEYDQAADAGSGGGATAPPPLPENFTYDAPTGLFSYDLAPGTTPNDYLIEYV